MLRKTKQQKVINNNQILDQLERVVRWSNEFRLAFVKCNHPVQREEMRRGLLDRLKDKRVLEIFLEKPVVSLLDEITVRWDSSNPPDAVCIYGLEKSINEQREASPMLWRLNHERDLIRRSVPAALLIWLTDFALDCLARGAPDFWAWRSGVYEFTSDVKLWQMDSTVALDSDLSALFSLTFEEKQKEIARLEELLGTVRTLPHRGKRERETMARILYQLGILNESLSEWEAARAYYEKSLIIFEQLGHKEGMATTLHQLGIIAQDRGNLEEAYHLYKESLEIKKKLRDPQLIVSGLHQLGAIAQDQGDLVIAQQIYDKSLEIAKENGDKNSIAIILHNLAVIARDQGDLEKARRLCEESLEFKKRLGDQSIIASSLHLLGIIAQEQGDLVKARRLYNESLEIKRKLGNQMSTALTLSQLGLLAEEEGNKAEAVRLLLESLSIFERLKSPNAEIVRQSLKRVEQPADELTESTS